MDNLRQPVRCSPRHLRGWVSQEMLPAVGERCRVRHRQVWGNGGEEEEVRLKS